MVLRPSISCNGRGPHSSSRRHLSGARPPCSSSASLLFSRLALLTLAILSLALLLQTTDSREWAPSRRSMSASRRPNANLRLVRSDDNGMEETDDAVQLTKSDEASSESRSTDPETSLETLRPLPQGEEDKHGSSSSEQSDESLAGSSSESKPVLEKSSEESKAKDSRFDMEAFERLFKPKGPTANPNSGVEKGTETELPTIKIADSGNHEANKGKLNKTGVIAHSNNPAAKAEKATAKDEEYSEIIVITTTPAPVATEDSDTTDEAPAVEEGERVIEDGGDEADSESDESSESRAGSDTINTSKPPPKSISSKHLKSASNATKSTTMKPSSPTTVAAKLPKVKASGGKLVSSDNGTETFFKPPAISAKAHNSTAKVDEAIAELSVKSGNVVKRKNTTIIINGRKFDQVMSIECVDSAFYKTLTEDLGLINPSLRRDFYGTYYDPEYAKAIEAIVETPQVSGKEEEGAEGKPTKSVEDILDRVRRFWKETHDTFVAHKVDLGPAFGGMGGRLKRAVGAPKLPKHQAALANYRYLMDRLEQLKLMLMNGEEALIVLNNRVKKLNQVPTEDELHGALCSCITSRGGRAALSFMNELFVDKDSAKLMAKPEQGKTRGEAAARDVAEFCAFWYGDTMRSEAVQKEKQIKKLVIRVAKRKRTTKKKTTTITETKIIKSGNMTKREVHTRVVTAIVQMTELWMPKLAKWIKTTLDVIGQNVTDSKPVVQVIPNGSNSSRSNRTRRSSNSFFSTPFDEPSNYADLDRPTAFESVALMGGGRNVRSTGWRANSRERRAATTKAPSTGSGRKLKTTPKAAGHRLQSAGGKSNASNTDRMHVYPDVTPTPQPETTLGPRTTRRPEPDFESRVSNRTAECAKHGFAELISIGFDQNSLMYESNAIKKDDSYIEAFRKAFISSFPVYWKDRRDHWSRSMSGDVVAHGKSNKTLSDSGSLASKGRSVDEEIDDSLGDTGGSYERGARLGFTVGKFIGDKSAYQWPDPAELNTFTYDSLFLAGVGHGYTEEDSRTLEKKIVSETAKRVAFSEANRAAFAKTIRTAYLNGAFIVPQWGVLHAQRAVAKQAAKEGSKAGFDAASQAIKDFLPKANKFFLNHQHQRSLAAPYKPVAASSKGAEKWAGVAEQIEQVKREGELNRNISDSAIDCGQKSGSVMGALMGLIVAPEAFETYMRIRGSLEAFENEFNQFKLGAMRGYELGETWAHLNYTVSMNQNLQAMKSQMTSSASSLAGGGNSRAGVGGGHANKTQLLAERAKVDKISSNSLFESKSGDNTNATNTNNIFQYMVLNYGTYLVANHSRKMMLKFRSVGMDENLLHDMKIQAGDLIADADQMKLSSSDSDDGDELFESDHYNGELKGEFNSLDNKRKTPLKFNIIDLGPVLEMNDETGAPTRGSSHDSPLETTPLTSSLSKVGKIFMKFSVARRRGKRNPNGSDDVARFLNNGGPNGFDEGDGYLCGTFSQLTSHLANGTSVQTGQALQEDDFGTEVAILDELFERIERASPSMGGSVSLVEGLLGMTTAKPRSVESIADKTTAKPRRAPPSTTSSRPKKGTSSTARARGTSKAPAAGGKVTSSKPKTTTTTTTTSAKPTTTTTEQPAKSRSADLGQEDTNSELATEMAF